MASLWSTLIGTTQTNTATNERKNAQISEKVNIFRRGEKTSGFDNCICQL